MLEEQLRDTEMRHEDRLQEEQRRSKELITRVEREKQLQLENANIRLQSAETESSNLKEEVARQRMRIEKLEAERREFSDQIQDLRNELLSAKEYETTYKEQERRLIQEQKAHTQLIDELSREVERLRSEARTPALPTTSETLRLEELHEEMTTLREKNTQLQEANEELQASLLTAGVEQGRLLTAGETSLAAELEAMSHDQMTGDNLEMRELAARICRDYLHGAWKHVNAQNIGFKHISGGLSNLLYYISLPDSLVEKDKAGADPQEVLIRVYGQTHGEHALEALITESVIFTLLSERGLGPKLHGIFPGGRIEQYVNARPLITKELSDEHLSVNIAQKMAAIHCMEVPLHKTPGWLWETIERWLKSSEKRLNGEIPEHVKHLADVDLRKELTWLRQRLERENSPVVFCHNDMQEGNILMYQDDKDDNVKNNNAETKLVLIDFEYCSYNYRAFDIANHFVEWMYDYTEKEHPFFKANPENYPSEIQRLRFIRAYLDETGSKESPDKILREVELFTLASHFFWTLWAIVNTKTSQIPFGYWEYGAERLDAYFKMKECVPQIHSLKRKAHELD